MDDKTILSFIAIICITALETAAILTGLDGAYFALVITAVGTLAGFQIRGVIDREKIKV